MDAMARDMMKGQTESVESNLRKVGNSTGTTLPQAVLKKANLKEGDRVKISADEKGIRIEKADERHDRVMRLHEYSKMRHDRLYKELAK